VSIRTERMAIRITTDTGFDLSVRRKEVDVSSSPSSETYIELTFDPNPIVPMGAQEIPVQ